jgi:predicted permease
MRPSSLLEIVRFDIGSAFQSLRRAPAFALTVIGCLAVAIGANATVFTWMNGLVLEPLPAVRDMDRLISIKTARVGEALESGDDRQMSFPTYRDLRQQARSVDGLAGFDITQLALDDGGGSERRHSEPVWGLFTTANYFQVLGVRLSLGRAFLPEEGEHAGVGAVAVISDGLWRRRYGSDSTIIGKRVRLNGHELTIVGVAPASFLGTYVGLGFDLWMPVTMQSVIEGGPSDLESRSARGLLVFGRLRPGISQVEAASELKLLGERLAATYAEERDHALSVVPLDTGLSQRLRPLFIALLGLTGLVLLIVCANVANLLLVRGAARAHEIGVRLSLGAGRARIIRQLLTENLALALIGAALGAVLANAGRGLLGAIIPTAPLPIEIHTPLDTRVLVFTAIVAMLAAIVFGLMPAARSSRESLAVGLRAAGRSMSAARSRGRSALVVVQFGLSLAALVATGLFMRVLADSRAVDRGFRDPTRVLLVSTDLSLSGYRTPDARRQVVDRLVERARAIPGVQTAAAASFVPLGFSGYWTTEARMEGYAPKPNEEMSFLINAITPGYFTAMGIRVVAGRAIDDRDRADAAQVVMVNETLAKRYWPGMNPLGRRITLENREATVVGVAQDGKYRFDALQKPSSPFIYLPYAQFVTSGVTMHLRATGDPLALVPALRRVFDQVDANLLFVSPATLEEYSSGALFGPRLASTLLGGLGVVALLLAAFGLYAVMAYAVSQRTREIGIRVALGAEQRRVLSLFLGEAGVLVGVGLVLGLGLSALIATGLTKLLPRLNGSDPLAYGAAFGLLLVVALTASLIPARRASRVDPVVALRSE